MKYLSMLFLAVGISNAYAAAESTPTEPWLTVQSLYQFCESNEGSTAWITCASYVIGVSTMMESNGSLVRNGLDTSPGVLATSMCNSTTISNLAVVQAFKNWAAAHPEQWTSPGSDGVIYALSGLWPCT